ncbi:MAG: hypothetical protein Q4A56_00165 [Porphyromonadaceae bacterium]|nr:hypothetical protein [Porphyromonadaceae bacterium]
MAIRGGASISFEHCLPYTFVNNDKGAYFQALLYGYYRHIERKHKTMPKRGRYLR